MRLIPRLTALTLQLSFLICTLATVATAAAFQPTAVGDGFDERLRGIWASRGYGWIVEIQGDEAIRFFDHTSVACLGEAVSTEELLSFARLFARQDETLQITNAQRDATIYTFDRIDRVPAHCESVPAGGPEETLAHFAETMGTHYAFFDVFGVDWPARVRAAEAVVSPESNDQELFSALGDMLEGMRDGHLRLLAEIDGAREIVRPGRATIGFLLDDAFESQRKVKDKGKFQQKWLETQNKQVHKDLLGRSAKEHARLVWGRVGRIGYLAISGMTGFSEGDGGREEELAAVHAAMEKAIPDLADTDALVIDVTLNGGGSDSVSLAIASHFTDTETLSFTKQAHAAEGAQPQPFFVDPAPRARYRRPVTLLTSNYTVSAAEIFTMAMRAMPQVTHRGEATRGALSDVLEKDLVNGWSLTLSNEIYRDSEGVLWEGRGIPPTDPITIFDGDNIQHSRLGAIREAIARTEVALGD